MIDWKTIWKLLVLIVEILLVFFWFPATDPRH